MVNRRVVLRSRPAHVPQPDNFEIVSGEVPEPGDGEILVRNLYFSIEPAIRARLDGKETYMPPIGIGEPIQSPTVGRVVRSRHPDYQEGEVLFGFNNWDDYVIVQRRHPAARPPVAGGGDAALLLRRCAGRIGHHCVCRAARHRGDPGRRDRGDQRGRRWRGQRRRADRAPAGVPRRRTRRLGRQGRRRQGPPRASTRRSTTARCPISRRRWRRRVPMGWTCTTTTSAAPTLDAMLVNMKSFGRIVACGMMAGYNQQDEPPPVRHLWEVVARQLRMQGFLLPFFPDSIQKGLEELHGWVRSGELQVLENVTHGLPSRARGILRPDGRQHGRQDVARARRGPTCTTRAWRPWRGRSAELRHADRRRDARGGGAPLGDRVRGPARHDRVADGEHQRRGARRRGARAAFAGHDDAVGRSRRRDRRETLSTSVTPPAVISVRGRQRHDLAARRRPRGAGRAARGSRPGCRRRTRSRASRASPVRRRPRARARPR